MKEYLVYLRHSDIAHDHVRTCEDEELERGGGGGSEVDGCAGGPERLSDELAHVVLVLDDEGR